MGPRARGRSTTSAVPGAAAFARRGALKAGNARLLPEDFVADAVFHERRCTLTLARADGTARSPVLLDESGCHVSGAAAGRPLRIVLDDPGAVALRGTAGSLAEALLDPSAVTGEGLHERIARIAGFLPSLFEKWEKEALASGSDRGAAVAGVRMEVRISLGVITAAHSRGEAPFIAARDAREALEGRVAVTLRHQGRAITVEETRWADAGAQTGPFDAWGGAAAAAVLRGADLLEAVPPPAMESPVLFVPAAAGLLLHEICGHLLEADLVAASASPFAALLGARVAASGVTLADDPRLPGGRVRLRVDDEGEETRSCVLIEAGILRGLLSDGSSSAATGGLSTGHARRESYRFAPLPRMTNLVMAAGPEDPADLRRGIPRGLLVERLGRGQVDPRRGEFRLEVESGRFIEDGTAGRPVAGAFLVGSCRDLLASIDGVGADVRLDSGAGSCIKDDQIVPVGAAAPTVRAARVRILPGVSP